MIRHYLAVALRHLRRQFGYSFINIAGLAISLTCCLLLTLYIRHELSYDRFHRNADQIYRIAGDRFAPTPGPWAPALVRDFPEVRQAVRIKPPFNSWHVGAGDRRFREKGFFVADDGFFEMFDFTLLKGDPNTVLAAPNNVVISEAAAQRYFGDDDPIGKTLSVENRFELTVVGLMQDMPANSHFRCDFLVSFATVEADQNWYGDITSFSGGGVNLSVYTYLLMQPGSDADAFADKIPGFLETYMGDQATAGMLSQRFTLQPLTDIYLHSALDAELGATGSISSVYLFVMLAFFVLLLACINFMNLSTARAAARAGEVGMRKVLGAGRRQLVGQFMGEALCTAVLAMLLALGLTDLALPAFSNLAGKEITTDYTDAAFWLSAVGITLFTGLLAGGYPAFFLSALRPMSTVRRADTSGRMHAFVRKGLVIMQFGISIVMIISAGMAYLQMNHFYTKPPGFDREHLVVVPLADGAQRQRYAVWKQALLQHPDIVRVAGASSKPGEQTLGRYLLKPENGGEEQAGASALYVTDFDYLETLGIALSAGRDFSREDMTDAAQGVLINETAAAVLGLTQPVGARVELSIPLTRTVIGVIRDFHAQSLHHPIEPVVILANPEAQAQSFLYTLIRIRGENIPKAVEQIRKSWEEVFPDYPFEYAFLDEDMNRQYAAEQRMQHIFSLAAVMAMIIACLGIFGLASFMAERRTKELGVRKVIGASKADLIRLLSVDFIRLVCIANLLAWPVAYLAVQQWLASFAYRVDTDPAVFLLALLLTLTVTLLTTGYHALRAARINPVEALRY